jgi:diacylglycerol kinase family enzyme
MRHEPSLTGPLARPVGLRRIEIVANERSGSVGPGAAADAARIAADLGFEVNARAIGQGDDLMAELTLAVDARPDLLVVISGDGTANAAAALCGPEGPLIAPLPGGTMNMLPHALYGRAPWRESLAAILTDGRVRPVGGGEVQGRPFHVAAILGDPTLWAPVREALRKGRLAEAWRRAVHAWGRCFRRKLRFSLDGAPYRKAQALALLCPLVSRGIPHDTPALEAAIIDPPGFAEVMRLGLHTLLSSLMAPESGLDWRRDPSVTSGQCQEGRAYSPRHIHATLDGEPVRLPKYATLRFVPVAFRALVPGPAPDGEPPTA